MIDNTRSSLKEAVFHEKKPNVMSSKFWFWKTAVCVSPCQYRIKMLCGIYHDNTMHVTIQYNAVCSALHYTVMTGLCMNIAPTYSIYVYIYKYTV